MVQLSHPYMTTGKTIALTRQTFVSKVMPLLKEQVSFNFMAEVTIHFDFGAQMKFDIVSTLSPWCTNGAGKTVYPHAEEDTYLT